MLQLVFASSVISVLSSEHIAPVLSVTSALDDTVVVSGGEDSRIIITSLKTKEVIIKIDHHRGPVTAVRPTASGDILISGNDQFILSVYNSYVYYVELSN